MVGGSEIVKFKLTKTMNDRNYIGSDSVEAILSYNPSKGRCVENARALLETTKKKFDRGMEEKGQSEAWQDMIRPHPTLQAAAQVVNLHNEDKRFAFLMEQVLKANMPPSVTVIVLYNSGFDPIVLCDVMELLISLGLVES